MAPGVSIIICTHNGASRLPTTLAHIKAQVPPRVPWEVVLIDNASTDETAKVALSCWSVGPAPLRVVHEAKLGLQNARERGLKESRYDFLGFVDDDNWIAPDWVQVADEVLASDSSLGAVGSVSEPVFEGVEPRWFGEFHTMYAILTASDLDQSDEMPKYLNGAGLCVRKQAWTELIRAGFRSLTTDRVGARLSGGGDTELTWAIRLAGWKIRIERRLRLQHFMPVGRLRWDYRRRLERGYAASWVLLDAYTTYNLSTTRGLKSRLGQQWWCQLGRSLMRLVSQPGPVFTAMTSSGENRQDVLEVEKLTGRIIGLLRLRSRYTHSRHLVRDAPWRLR
jgi:glycosyltransferase involved in cell wall biosynthesis